VGIFGNKNAGMGKIHGNPAKYWEYQQRFAREKLIPLLGEWGIDLEGKRVLEIGSGYGGIIDAFAEAGADCLGVEINANRVQSGRQFATNDVPIIIGDFCKQEILQQIEGKWDIILLPDALEHLLDKETAMRNLDKIVADDGCIFFDFGPWYMPFGGHQQVLKSFLRYIPFFHWLPRSIFERLIFWSERDRMEIFHDIMDIYDARITLRQFYKLLERHQFRIDKKQLYLICPSYEIKFGMREIKLGLFAHIPLLPEIATIKLYAIVKKSGS